LLWWALGLSLVGRNEKMEAAARRLVRVDPLSSLSRSLLGLARQIQGDLQGGLEELEVCYRGSQEGSSESFFYAHALATVGRKDEALAILRSEFAPDTEGQFAPVARMLRAALEDDPEGMDAALTPEFRAKLDRDVGMVVYTTGIHALAGRRDATYEGLRRMVDGGFRNYPWLTHDPWISSYRDDPAFQSLFEEVQDAWERSR